MISQIYICEIPETPKYAEAEAAEGTYDFDVFEKCPKCSRRVSGGYWKKPHIVDISKRKLPDFMYIYGGTGTFLVSERVLNTFRQNQLTGILLAEEIDEIRFRGKALNSQSIPRYYSLKLARSFVSIDHEKSEILYGDYHEEQVCPLCNPKGATKDFFRSLHMNMDCYEGYDIFTIYELGEATFVSQRFVDFCEQNGFTNLRATSIENYDTMTPLGF